MNIILFGFKSCGKSTVGKALAKDLQYAFYDIDSLIEKMYYEKEGVNKTFREIFQKHGSNYFRSLEKEVIHSFQPKQNSVIACGGGSILDPENASYLKKIGTLIFLDVEKETLKKRIFPHNIPAYFDSKDPHASFEKEWTLRYPIYQALADIVISIQDQDISEVLVQLHNRIQGK